MVDSHVMKIAYIKSIIHIEGIGINDAFRLNLLLNNGQDFFVLALGMTAVYTFPPRFSRPNTAAPLPAAPLPRLPFVTPPK